MNSPGIREQFRRSGRTCDANEDDIVTSADLYAEARWDLPRAFASLGHPLEPASTMLQTDFYVVGPNPDDSGSRTFRTPVRWRAWSGMRNDVLNVYLSYGQGFETPTFAESAYRPVGTGLNLALDPATSTADRLGMKWLPAVEPAHHPSPCSRPTTDQEIVDRNGNGRAHHLSQCRARLTGAASRRNGTPIWEHGLHRARELHLPSPPSSRTPTCRHPAGGDPGGRAPAGCAPATGLRCPRLDAGGFAGFSAAGEVQYVGRIYVNDHEHRVCARVHDRQRARRLRAGTSGA